MKEVFIKCWNVFSLVIRFFVIQVLNILIFISMVIRYAPDSRLIEGAFLTYLSAMEIYLRNNP